MEPLPNSVRLSNIKTAITVKVAKTANNIFSIRSLITYPFQLLCFDENI